MDIELSHIELEIFKQIAAISNKLGMPCYLIGGFVRDKIIGRSVKDIDIVCIGDGIELANAFAETLHPKPIVT